MSDVPARREVEAAEIEVSIDMDRPLEKGLLKRGSVFITDLGPHLFNLGSELLSFSNPAYQFIDFFYYFKRCFFGCKQS